MEALAALSVAAAAVQFFDFSTKIISKGQQLYRSTDGVLAENVDTEEVSKRLKKLTEPLRVSFQDDAITVICDSCVQISNELIARLDKLKVPSGHPHKRWKSFRQAIKSVSSKEEIKDIKLRLESLRGELDTHVALNIRDKVTILSIQQDTRFTSLDAEVRKIIVSLLNLKGMFREELDKQSSEIIRFESLEHIKTRAITIDQRKSQLDTRVCQSILESLHYSTRTIRHETIHEAHKETFEWIFRDPENDGKPWDHFGHWLENGTGIYWINGKAGSGKSTLMKFLVDHEKTQHLLEVWANGTTLETPSFFFWKSGTEDQRSQEGLFKSLLYDVLQEHHELIPMVFPDIWTKHREIAANNVPHTFSVWSLARLKKAFAILVKSSTLRICFFIDGLDEYDGDYEELAEYFAQLSCSVNVKLCLASRPWPAFVDTFKDCAGLRLQDLTRNDIERYVSDKVRSNAKMVELARREPQRTSNLFSVLIYKAEGVFLWVTLVVKTLLRGLSHRNDITTLEKRLYAIPPDLEKLYSHMLSSIDSEDLADGSKIFQLMKTWGENIEYHDLQVEKVYHSLKGIYSQALEPALLRPEGNPKTPQNDRFEKISQEMEIILQTCCGGLIEIHYEEATYLHRKIGHLSYIHRTVAEFLSDGATWNMILSYTAQSSWVPLEALLFSVVICLKKEPFLGLSSFPQSWRLVNNHWFYFSSLFSSNNLPRSSLDCITALFDAFDLHSAQIAISYQWSQSNNGTDYDHWSNYIFRSSWPKENFLAFATESGLWFYVKHQFESDASLSVQIVEYPLLIRTFMTMWKEGEVVYQLTQRIIDTLEIILSFSTSPNEVFRGYKTWQYWMTMLHTIKLTRLFDTELLKVLQRGSILMLQAGADLETRCIEVEETWLDVYPTVPSEGHHEYYSKFSGVGISDLIHHSREALRDMYGGMEEKKTFASTTNAKLGDKHCLKAVIEDVFREHLPDGADELLQLIEKLEVERASKQSLVVVRDRKRESLDENADQA